MTFMNISLPSKLVSAARLLPIATETMREVKEKVGLA